MKFIHAADIHLDSPLRRLEVYEGAPAEEIRQASRRAFENLVDLALGEAVDFVLIAGDLFDGDWKDYNSGLYFVRQMRRLDEARIPVFIVSGNHDAEGKMTRTLPYPENVFIFSPRKPETKTLVELNVSIHGQSFARAAMFDNLALGYPEPVPGHFNIGLLHTSLTGREGHAPYAPCTVEDLMSRGYDYWALGHVHQFEQVSADPPIIFPGCIQGRHVRETGAKGCVLVTMAEGVAPEITRYPLDVIRWARIDVDLANTNELAEAFSYFRNALNDEIDSNAPLPVAVRLSFHGQTSIHQQLIADPDEIKESVRATALATCGEQAWIEKVRIDTTPVGQVTPAPGPLKELAELVETIASDDAELMAIGEALTDLFKKLPSDYRQGEGRIQPDDPELLRALLRQSHALLVRKLRKEAAAT